MSRRMAGQPAVTTLRSSRPLTAATTTGIRRVRTRPNIIVARASLARTAATRRRRGEPLHRGEPPSFRGDLPPRYRGEPPPYRGDLPSRPHLRGDRVGRGDPPYTYRSELPPHRGGELRRGDTQRIVVAAVGAIHRTRTIAGGVLGHAHRSEAFAALGNFSSLRMHSARHSASGYIASPWYSCR